MKEVISQILNLDIEDVSIKATITERLGFVGKGEGVSAYSVVLISKELIH
jgi:2-C-methyl-D-erythritol 2,4-cyclodiphosphate synthase